MSKKQNSQATPSRSTLRAARLDNINAAIKALRAASKSLKLAQQQTLWLNSNATDCADYAKQIDALLSSDGGECGLEPLAGLYAVGIRHDADR